MHSNPNAKPALTPSWTLFSRSYELVLHNLDKVIVLSLLPTLTLQLGILLVARHMAIGVAVYIGALVWVGISAPALYFFEVRASRGEEIGVGASFRQGLRYLWRVLIYSLIVGLMVGAGLLLLIVPGLILLRRYALGIYYIVDKDLSIDDAMRMCAEQSKPASGYIWGTLGVLLLCSLVVGILGATFAGVPGLSAIVTSVISLSFIFLLPLRYVDITDHATTPTK